MAPVVYTLTKQGLSPWLLATGQHREQLDSMLHVFNLKADANLNLMQERQNLPDLMARMLPLVARYLRDLNPLMSLSMAIL
ncbi:MAG: hypothetical protein R2865_13355 [Deinococcales bacterium]